MTIAFDPETWRSVLESLPAGIYLVDLHRRILLWNDGAEKLTGYLRQEVIGRCCADDLLMHCDEHHATLCGEACPVANTMHDGRPREADVYLRHKDGQRIPVRVRAVPIRNEHDAIIGAVECFDVRQVSPAALEPAACLHNEVDEVTQLPGRQSIAARLEAAIADFAVHRIPFGVLSIAISDMEGLTHADGRDALDEVLYGAAQTVRFNIGPADAVGRWSEDRMLAIIHGCSAAMLATAALRLERLASLSAVPWWGDRLNVSLATGGAVVLEGDTSESLAARAEQALADRLQKGGSL